MTCRRNDVGHARAAAASAAVVQAALVFVLAGSTPGLAQQLPGPGPDDEIDALEYVIGPEDVLEIAVWNNTAISRTVPVRPDGRISLPVLNDVDAAGLTPMELRELLTKALAVYMQAPEVAVIVREVHSFKVSVIGEVNTPGRYTLASRATVLDVLALAGGLSEYADQGRITILRRTAAGTQQIPFAYDKVMPANGSRGQDNLFVEPDDIILVR